MTSTICFSENTSRLLVASSKISKRGFLSRARAIAIFCFSPPLNDVPFSPTKVSKPFGKDTILSYIPTSFATSSICPFLYASLNISIVSLRYQYLVNLYHSKGFFLFEVYKI